MRFGDFCHFASRDFQYIVILREFGSISELFGGFTVPVTCCDGLSLHYVGAVALYCEKLKDQSDFFFCPLGSLTPSDLPVTHLGAPLKPPPPILEGKVGCGRAEIHSRRTEF